MSERTCPGCSRPAGDEHLRTYCQHCGTELPDGFLVRHGRVRLGSEIPSTPEGITGTFAPPAPAWVAAGAPPAPHAPAPPAPVTRSDAVPTATGPVVPPTPAGTAGAPRAAPTGAAFLAAAVSILAALALLVAAVGALGSPEYLGDLLTAFQGDVPDSVAEDRGPAGGGAVEDDALDAFVAANAHTTARLLVILGVVVVLVLMAQVLFAWWLWRAAATNAGPSARRLTPRRAIAALLRPETPSGPVATAAGPQGVAATPTMARPVFVAWWWGAVTTVVVVPGMALALSGAGADRGDVVALTAAVGACWVALFLGVQVALVMGTTRAQARALAATS